MTALAFMGCPFRTGRLDEELPHSKSAARVLQNGTVMCPQPLCLIRKRVTAMDMLFVYCVGVVRRSSYASCRLLQRHSPVLQHPAACVSPANAMVHLWRQALLLQRS
eukprot:9412227-Pyramimonas_sp.AAC.1